MTQEVVDKLIRKDMIDPISGKKLTEDDIIPIQRVNNVYFINFNLFFLSRPSERF